MNYKNKKSFFKLKKTKNFFENIFFGNSISWKSAHSEALINKGFAGMCNIKTFNTQGFANYFFEKI